MNRRFCDFVLCSEHTSPTSVAQEAGGLPDVPHGLVELRESPHEGPLQHERREGHWTCDAHIYHLDCVSVGDGGVTKRLHRLSHCGEKLFLKKQNKNTDVF